FVHRIISKTANSLTGEMAFPFLCRGLLRYVQMRAERLAIYRRKQVSENDRRQRASLGFVRD
ncbi:hypothetical protein OAL21_05515, partial [Akkermansiaceae bacterium]|nr:hypothetical protein [Akkermansiaceae bacterium]